jgi:hypothetical protein
MLGTDFAVETGNGGPDGGVPGVKIFENEAFETHFYGSKREDLLLLL